jgi:HPt (histidine-containing phosphotransfer) domain-containing protein
MDGIEAARAIREMGGDHRQLPIVAMTANALAGMDEYFASSGMNDFLPKPIDTNRLNVLLRRWLPADKIDDMPSLSFKRAESGTMRYEFSRLRGIDSVLGLSRSGDNLEAYLKTMKYFLKDVRDMPGAIRSAYHRHDGRSMASLAHALKGSCWAIGARQLAELSLSIESNVAGADMSNVSALIETLLRDLSETRDDLSAFVGQTENESLREGGDMASQEEIFADLGALRRAFVETDAGGIDRSIKKLQGRYIPLWLRNSLEQLWSHFQEVEYDEAIEEIDSILEGEWPRRSPTGPVGTRRPH